MSKKFIGFLGLIVAFGGVGVATGIDYYFSGNNNMLLLSGINVLIVGGILWHGKLNFLKGRGGYNPDLEEVKQHFQKEFKPTEQEKKEAVRLIRQYLTEKYGFPREWQGASNNRFRILAGDAAGKAYTLIFMKGANVVEINEIAAEAIKDYIGGYITPVRIDDCISYLHNPLVTDEDKAKDILHETRLMFGVPRYLNSTRVDIAVITKVNDFVLKSVRDYWPEFINSNSEAITNDLHVGLAHAIIIEYWGNHITSAQLEEARQLIFSKLAPNEEVIEAEVVSEAGTWSDHHYNVTKEAVGVNNLKQLPSGWYYDNGGRLRNEKGRYAKLPEAEVK